MGDATREIRETFEYLKNERQINESRRSQQCPRSKPAECGDLCHVGGFILRSRRRLHIGYDEVRESNFDSGKMVSVSR